MTVDPHDSTHDVAGRIFNQPSAPPEPERCSKIAQMIAASLPVFVLFGMGVGFTLGVLIREMPHEQRELMETLSTLISLPLILIFWVVVIRASVLQSSINKGLRLLTKFFIGSAILLEVVALWSWWYVPNPPGAIFPVWSVAILATVVTAQMVFFGVKFYRKLSRDIYLEEYGEYDPTGMSEKKRVVALALVMLGLGGLGGMHRIYAGRHISGVIMLLTLGGLGGWTFYDLLLMITDKFVDSEGRVLEKNNTIDWVVLVSAYFLAPSLSIFVLFWTWRLIF